MSGPTAANGFLATFAVTATNTTGAPLLNVVISDPLSAMVGVGLTGLTFTAAAGVTASVGTGLITIASLGTGASVTTNVAVTVPGGLLTGATLSNTASLLSVNGTPVIGITAVATT